MKLDSFTEESLPPGRLHRSLSIESFVLIECERSDLGQIRSLLKATPNTRPSRVSELSGIGSNISYDKRYTLQYTLHFQATREHPRAMTTMFFSEQPQQPYHVARKLFAASHVLCS